MGAEEEEEEENFNSDVLYDVTDEMLDAAEEAMKEMLLTRRVTIEQM